jgi:hypothetical protein
MTVVPNATYSQFQSEAGVLAKFIAVLGDSALLFYVASSPRALRMKAYGQNDTYDLALGKFAWCSGFVYNNNVYVYYSTDNGTMRVMLIDKIGSASYKTYGVNLTSYRTTSFAALKVGNHFYMGLDTGSGLALLKASDFVFANLEEILEPIYDISGTAYKKPALGYDSSKLNNGNLSEIVLASEVHDSTGNNVVFYSIPLKT